MVPIKLNFGITDIFLSPRLALSGKKIWTLTIGNLIGYLSYVTFSFLAYEISYQDISKSVTDLGLFPVLFRKRFINTFMVRLCYRNYIMDSFLSFFIDNII